MIVERGSETFKAARRAFVRGALAAGGGAGFPAAPSGSAPDPLATALLLPHAAPALAPEELARVVGWLLTHQGPGGGFTAASPGTSPAALTAHAHNALVALQLGGAANERWTHARRRAAGWLGALAGGHAPSAAVPPAELGAIARALAVTVGVQHAPLLYRTLEGVVAALGHRLATSRCTPERLWLAHGLLGVFHELGSRGHLEQVAAIVDVLAGAPPVAAHDALLVHLACDVGSAARVGDRVAGLATALEGERPIEPATDAPPGDPLALEPYARVLAHDALCRYAETAEGRTQIPVWVRTGDGELETSPHRRVLPGPRDPALAEPAGSAHRLHTVFLPHEPTSQACPYLRVHGPLEAAARTGSIAYEPGADPTRRYVLLSTAAFGRADVFVYQRLFPAWLLGAMTTGRIERSGAAVVYDLDDLLFEMPADHPKRSVVRPALPAMRRALATVDLVTTSTDALAAHLAALGAPRVVTIPNAVSPADWPETPRQTPRDETAPVVLGCVGTATHAADYARITPVLLELLERHAGRLEVEIWGDAPAPLAGHPAVTVDPHYVSSYREYAHKLASARIDIGLVPLAPGAFNESKSAVKWLELSAAGIPGVYADTGQYAQWIDDGETGLLAGDDPTAWRTAIESLLTDPSRRAHLARAAHARVHRAHTLDAAASAWTAALEEARRLRSDRRLESVRVPAPGGTRSNPIRIPLTELVAG